jgi:hypothetical protein
MADNVIRIPTAGFHHETCLQRCAASYLWCGPHFVVAAQATRVLVRSHHERP